jgi:hypothetical protein
LKGDIIGFEGKMPPWLELLSTNFSEVVLYLFDSL